MVAKGPAPKVAGFGGGSRNEIPLPDLPAHCRVQIDLTPTTDSMIKMELWLPAENWNGKFMGVGNGFFAGSIQGVLFDIIRIAFNDPNLDWRKFDLERDMPLIDKAVGYVDAVDPDLTKFKASGGKLLLSHGWSDTGINPETTI
jgi:hypothetical protein